MKLEIYQISRKTVDEQRGPGSYEEVGFNISPKNPAHQYFGSTAERTIIKNNNSGSALGPGSYNLRSEFDLKKRTLNTAAFMSKRQNIFASSENKIPGPGDYDVV